MCHSTHYTSHHSNQCARAIYSDNVRGLYILTVAFAATIYSASGNEWISKLYALQ